MSALFGYIGTYDDALCGGMRNAIGGRGKAERLIKQQNFVVSYQNIELSDLDAHIKTDTAGRTFVLDGDIINKNELRNILGENGHKGALNSDADILAGLYAIFGDAFPEHIDGPFIAVIHDRDRLLIARDRMGVRPFFYHYAGDRFSFASQIKSLIGGISEDLEIDEESLYQRCVFGDHLLGSSTYLKGVYQVRAGQICSVTNLTGDLTIKSSEYGARALDIPEAGSEEFRDNIRRTIEKNVQYYVESRRSVGVFLSGGFDSSVLASLAVKYAKGPVKSYTISDDPDFPDVIAAREVADHLGLEHREIIIDTGSDKANLVEGIYAYEDLIYRDTIFNLAKHAHGEVDAVLSGACAQIFGLPVLMRNRIRPARISWDKITTATSGAAKDTSFGDFMSRFIQGISDDPEATLLGHFLNDYIPNQLFPSTERATEYFGLEAVFPFADPLLHAYSNTLTYDDRITDGVEKPILREAFSNADLPANILSRPTLCSKYNFKQAKENMRREIAGISSSVYVAAEKDYLFPTEYLSLCFGIFKDMFVDRLDPQEVVKKLEKAA